MAKPIIYGINEIKRKIPWLLIQAEQFEFMSRRSEYTDEQRAILAKAATGNKKQVEIYRELIRLSKP